ncbi:hypothetical protein BM1_09023 [Bipolaris maydis]|nr:hypothetical protein BM1_09023 [Bipolaris maydis]
MLCERQRHDSAKMKSFSITFFALLSWIPTIQAYEQCGINLRSVLAMTGLSYPILSESLSNVFNRI